MSITARIRSFFTGTTATRSFEAATPGRRRLPEMAQPRAVTTASAGTLMRRARYARANAPLASAATIAFVSAMTGTGIKPQASSVAELAAAFETWTDDADATGATDWYGLQAATAEGLMVDGEAFFIVSMGPTGPRLSQLDPDQIDRSLFRTLANGGAIEGGVEVDASGRPQAYWVLPRAPGAIDFHYAAQRIDARDIIHVFEKRWPGQVRGVSMFAPILQRLADLDSAQDAQLTRQKVAAMLTGFITDVNGTRPNFGPDDELKDGAIEASLEPGTMQELPPGRDVRFSDPAKVGAEVIEFMSLTADEVAAGLGMPPFVLTGRLGEVNFSSARVGLVQFRRRIEALQYSTIVHQMCRPVWQRFVTWMILTGRYNAPDFEANPRKYFKVNWIPPKNEWLDPLKDVTAEIAAIRAGLISRRQAVAARGLDIDSLDAEIAADRAREAALRIAFDTTLPAVAQEAAP